MGGCGLAQVGGGRPRGAQTAAVDSASDWMMDQCLKAQD